MQSLRRIAVTVEEPDPGRFAWILIERIGRSWREIDRADATAGHYSAAMSDGLLALEAMTESLALAPRARRPDPAQPGRHVPSRPRRRESRRPAHEDGTIGKAFFGFGPAR